MADKKKAEELRKKSKDIARKELERRKGFPVAPRKAMSNAKKASKHLRYPLPPYPAGNPVRLFTWAQQEWENLGRWQNLALPVIVITALLTWEKEKAMQAQYYYDMEREQLKSEMNARYGAYREKRRGRKLLGIIPFPGRSR